MSRHDRYHRPVMGVAFVALALLSLVLGVTDKVVGAAVSRLPVVGAWSKRHADKKRRTHANDPGRIRKGPSARTRGNIGDRAAITFSPLNRARDRPVHNHVRGWGHCT